MNAVEVKVAGVGKHLDVLLVTNPEALIRWAKCGYAIEQLYSIAVVFPKLSILASYLRIFLTKPYRVTTYTLAAIIVANGIAGVITSFASCRPFSSRWTQMAYADKYCIDTVAYWRWISFPNIITDLVMLVLPLPVIWSLRLAKKDRLALVAIFCCGSMYVSS
jgi:hypothetical protein